MNNKVQSCSVLSPFHGDYILIRWTMNKPKCKYIIQSQIMASNLSESRGDRILIRMGLRKNEMLQKKIVI